MRKVTKYKLGIGTAIVILIYYKFFTIKEPDWNLINDLDIVEREVKDVQKFDKWIVITTIQPPTEAIQRLSQLKGWRLVVVGDRKTPKNWKQSNVVYLDTEAQKYQKYRVHEYLPYDSYTRKIIGYLYAIEHGAQFIYETDDDNIIENLEIFHTTRANKGLVVFTDDVTYNPYPHFGQVSVWPRGFPMDHLGANIPRNYLLCSINTPAIQQGLINGEPDVDAVFRMTRKHNNKNSDKINFDTNAPMVLVPQGTYAPFNSQNTLYLRKAFWALILPTMFTDRTTDIYRAYWAEKLLWLVGSNVAFYPPNGIHKRNSWHSAINDAKEESSLYSDMGRYITFLDKWTCTKLFFFDCVSQLTEDLVIMGFWSKRDLLLVNAWLSDLATISYAPPALKISHSSHLCEHSDHINLVYYPWEQNTTMHYTNELAVLQNSNNFKQMQKHSSDLCGLAHHVYFENAIIKAPKYSDVLLVVTVYGNISVIPTLDVIYRIHFAHILYCGSVLVDLDMLNAMKVSYIGLKNAEPVKCVNEASKMNYNVVGYLHVTENAFLQFEKLHVSERNKEQMWVTGLDLYIFKPLTINMCKLGKLKCVQTNKETFFMLADKINTLNEESKKTKEYMKCVQKIGSDPTLKMNKVTTSKELTFYVPHRLSTSLHELVDVYLKDKVFDNYEFLAILILECVEIPTEYLHTSDVQDMSSTNHFDYVFPFLFRDIHVRQNNDLKNKYCDYIKNH